MRDSRPRQPGAEMALLVLITLLSIPPGSRADPGGELMLSSPAFASGRSIPARYTCEDANISPPLHWQGVPKAARSLVLIVDDPDAPDPRAPRVTWVHWVLYNIPVTAMGLPEHTKAGDLPRGTGQGRNSWSKMGYGGPCPPIGRHRYFFKLYALDTVLTGLTSPTSKQLETAMGDHIVARYSLIGTYEKSR